MDSDDDYFPMVSRSHLDRGARASSSEIHDSQAATRVALANDPIQSSCMVSAQPQLQQQGPLIVVAFVAVPLGRWCQLFGRHCVGSDSRKVLDSSLVIGKHMLDRFGAQVALVDSDSIEIPSIVGFGLVRSWDLVREYPVDPHSRCMIHELASLHRKSLILNFLRHDVLEGVLLDCPVACCIGWSELPDSAPIAQELLGTFSQMRCHRWSRTGHDVELQASMQVCEVIRRWRIKHSVRDNVYYWPLWSPLALAVSLGVWPCDISEIVQRDCGREWTPPVMPTRRMLQKFKVNQQFVIPLRHSIDCQVGW
jgi:hypothetical protein